MTATKADTTDLKIEFCYVIGAILSLINGLGVVPLCYAIYRIVPNFYLFFCLATCTTCVVFQTTLAFFNLSGIVSSLIEGKLARKPISDFLTLMGSWALVIQGKILHGYEIHGKENLPKDTGALIVYHHALVPYDVLYLMADYYIERRKKLGGIIHQNLRRLWYGVSELYDFISSKDELVQNLKDGYIRTVSPGGNRETVLSKNYELIWDGRKGFAEVAKQTGVPIIPMFLVNGQQAMPIRTFGLERTFKEVWDKKKLAIWIPVFSFPVKLRIIIGKPIYCGADESVEAFKQRAKCAIEALRDEHQQMPGNFLSALLERFNIKQCHKKSDESKSE